MISIKIKDPLFTYRAQLVNILDFNPKKLSIEKVCAIDDEQEHIYYIKYGGDPFYLVISGLKGYFKCSKEKNATEPSSSEHKKELEFIIEDQKQEYFCGYLDNDTTGSSSSERIIKPLCVILPQMNGYIKYFDDGGKNMSFVTDDEKVYEKYDEIWNVVKGLLKLKFAASPIRNDKYILAKLKILKKNKI